MQQRRERVHVVALERIDVAIQQCAARVVEGLGVARDLRLAAGHRRPRALERAVDRCDGGPEQLPDLLRPPAKHLAQDEDGPLPRREVLECGDEREAYRLARDRHVRGIAVGHDAAIRHRLDPDRFGEGRRERRVGALRRVEVHRPCATLARPEHRKADVRRDAVQPGAKGRAPLELVVGAPGADERLLDGVLRLEGRAEHPIAVAGELRSEDFELRHHVRWRRRRRAALGGRFLSLRPSYPSRPAATREPTRPSPKRRASAGSAGSSPGATSRW